MFCCQTLLPHVGSPSCPASHAAPAPSQVEDKIMEIAVFEKFLKDHIKVDNKTNNLGSTVSVVREKAKLSVHSDVAMSKRYMKYLTKKCVAAQRP